ncbi:hypothetical protein SAMN05877838_0226 [Hoeflea halophila]|uniref:Uncharacterized protein n=1 Tax=Hoeflea halophila TaxID=714899 RepID=A0A286HMX2_9HYPH|nr:hypothetical protein [Hoeflea halophila]SOE08504.1 hypothetical protein SAMN05877838_0226 [Hoeflea halophila]
MNTNYTTTPADGAVWTEKEMFQHFLNMTLKDYDAFGNIVNEYEPDTLLSSAGGYETLEDFLDQILDDFSEFEGPETRLDNMIMDMGAYISALRKVRAAFRSLKQHHIIIPPEPDETVDGATWEAWDRAAYEAEKNPRFRPVGLQPLADDSVDFVEPGDSPAPEPDFEDMTEADEESIRGVA